MALNLSKQKESIVTSIEERKAYLEKQPIFCLLTPTDIHELALLIREIHIEINEAIVEEGDNFDGFYLIVSGQAVVTRSLKRIEEKRERYIATLGAGNVIGLSEADFATQTGARTATVTSISPMVLLHISLEDFYQFLIRYGLTYPYLFQVSEKFLLTNFIHNIPLFNHLPIDKIHEIMSNSKKITAPAAKIFLNTKDMVEHCALIVKGKVSIFDASGNQLILEQGQLFGERIFKDLGQDNAFAYAATDIEILLIHTEHLIKSLENGDKRQTSTPKHHCLQQISLKANKDVLLLEQSKNRVILLSESHGSKLRLSQEEKELWQEINKQNTLETILEKQKKSLKGLSACEIYRIIIRFKQLGFVEFDGIIGCTQSKHWLKKLFCKITIFRKGTTNCDES